MNKRNITTVVFIIVVCLSIGSCVSHTLEKPQNFNELTIQNETSVPIQEVKLKVPNIRGLVSCDYIPPKGQCAVGFPERENKNNPLLFSWKQNNKTYARNLTVSIPEHIDKNLPSRVFINIFENGYLEAHMEQ